MTRDARVLGRGTGSLHTYGVLRASCQHTTLYTASLTAQSSDDRRQTSQCTVNTELRTVTRVMSQDTDTARTSSAGSGGMPATSNMLES